MKAFMVLLIASFGIATFAQAQQLPVCGIYHQGKTGDFLSVKADSVIFDIDAAYPAGVRAPADLSCACLTGKSVPGNGVKSNFNFVSITQSVQIDPISCVTLQ